MAETNSPRVSRAWIVAKKEFREIFRDKRTRATVIFGPLIVTPALFAIIGLAVSKKVEAVKAQTFHVGIVGGQAAPEILQALRTAPGLQLDDVPEAEAAARINKRQDDVVVSLPAQTGAQIAANRTAPLQILLDAGSETSQSAAQRVKGALGKLSDQLVAQRLRENRLSPDLAAPFQITDQPIAEGGSPAMLILSQLLPYILILSAFTGAIYAAFDQVAGEKERGTLETLLVSPATRRDLVLGKFAAVVGVCLVSSVMSVIGFIFPFVSHIKAFEFLSQGGVSLSATTIAVTLAVLLPISVLFAGLLLAVSTFARNQKEAQASLGTIMPVVLVPAVLSTVVGADASRLVALIPILNASIIIKQAINGHYDLVFIALAFAASLGYAALALALVAYLFQKESVLVKA